MRERRRWKYILMIPVAIAVLFAAQMADVFIYAQRARPVKSDAAIVLGAAAWGMKPSPVFRERINHAIDLYLGGYCRFIIITGGKGDPEEPGESVIGKKYAMQNGVPEDDIIIENYSRNTEQNLYYAKMIAAKRNVSSYILVSDPYHLRRATYIARRYGMIVCASGTPTSRYRSVGQKFMFLSREAYYMILCRIENISDVRIP
jgi:uncharacterized SAM-binding protein YcdF (DUF218 family)